ncbi:MAG: biotin/lipoyl-binding protein [Treponema sp.]|jgi:multidrug efflux pump subunit AcrA (membrane-fusion protein)|nr:biotin/lipoyl-binding protein [Treponema sp.]
MKLNRKTAGAVIFVLLVLLLFFSKTIYTYNLPEVTGTKPSRGSLSKLEISSGVASWAETEMLYSSSAGAVGRVFVREGDRVEEGDVLFEMDFDVAAARRRLAETNNNINKLEADVIGLRSRVKNIREALAAVSIEDQDAQSRLSGQAALIAAEINKARLLYQDSELAFEFGFQSRNDLINAQNNYRSALYKYEAEADDLEHSIYLKQMDMENLKLSRETILDMLADYRDNAVIRSPAAGIILELSVERGKYFQGNAFLASIGVGKEFTVECTISLDNNFVNPGDTCELSNANHILKGDVRRVRPSANGKIVTISITSEEISDGETFTVTFEKTGSSSFTLVPNSAINQDNNGYFLYQIKRRRGIMGEEYYLERLNIFIGDSDRQNTAVIRGITFFEPVVLFSNKALDAGVTVSLKNPEDFFEN